MPLARADPMIGNRASLALVLAGLALALAPVGCADDDSTEDIGESSQALTNGRIVVRQLGSAGPTIAKWG